MNDAARVDRPKNGALYHKIDTNQSTNSSKPLKCKVHKTLHEGRSQKLPRFLQMVTITKALKPTGMEDTDAKRGT